VRIEPAPAVLSKSIIAVITTTLAKYYEPQQCFVLLYNTNATIHSRQTVTGLEIFTALGDNPKTNRYRPGDIYSTT